VHLPADGSAIAAAIARLSYEYARSIDDRDWPAFRSVFTDVCDIDFRSWSGAPAASMPSDVWVQAVRSVTGAFDATQHLMTNLRLDQITGSAADVRDDGTADGAGTDADEPATVLGVNEVQAQHWFSGDSMASFGRQAEPAWCTLGGFFTNRYVLVDGAWRIAACRFTLRWCTGDESLFALARQRA
jgi:hypothetical protein